MLVDKSFNINYNGFIKSYVKETSYEFDDFERTVVASFPVVCGDIFCNILC